jgi:GPI mannosyltransferase 3
MQRTVLDGISTETTPVTSTDELSPEQEPIQTNLFEKYFDQEGLKLFGVLFLFRLWNSIFLATWFDPDETWQSLEVAHNMVFGVGALTWEWKLGIRGASHPLMFAAVYKIIQLVGLEHTSLLVLSC